MDEVPKTPLLPLPHQPAGVPWPTDDWPTGPLPSPDVAALLDEIFEDHRRYGITFATVMVHRGRLVAERYGGVLEHWDRPDEPVSAATPLLSWSMAKSVLHAIVGILVGEGRLDINARAAVRQWQDDTDSRHAITLQQLLEMRDGLAFLEDYVDDRTSDVIDMLFGTGQSDVAAFAASKPLVHPPGEVFNYSSGTSNIVARVVCDAIGGREDECRTFIHDRLFTPTGMMSASPRFDDAGTFIGSSYVYATAHDFARFGLLYLRDGVWDGQRLLPIGWVDHGRQARSSSPTDGRLHGAHWWVTGDEYGSFWASGYDGQSILCVPALDVVVVRLGKTPAGPTDHLAAWRRRIVEATAGS